MTTTKIIATQSPRFLNLGLKNMWEVYQGLEIKTGKFLTENHSVIKANSKEEAIEKYKIEEKNKYRW